MSTHELASYWTLWSQIMTSKKKQRPNLGPIYDFGTVEDFWAIYNSLKPPSEINGRVDLIFMRSQPNEEKKTEDGKTVYNRVSPEWEDANNQGGGEYRFSLDTTNQENSTNQDKQWEVTLLSVLGGSMPYSEEVSGVWLGCGRKGGSTLSVWKRTPVDGETPEESVAKLGNAWVEALKEAGVPVTAVSYTSHSDAIAGAKNNSNPPVSWQYPTV